MLPGTVGGVRRGFDEVFRVLDVALAPARLPLVRGENIGDDLARRAGDRHRNRVLVRCRLFERRELAIE